MRQELIDLLRGELAPAEETELRARLRTDAALTHEFEELQALSQFMCRGEEIEPSPEGRAVLMAAAERASRPSFVQQLRALPGLFRYRFQKSLAFRIAAVSLTVHLIAMGVLFQMSVPDRDAPDGGIVSFIVEETPDLRPDTSFVRSLSQRRAPHTVRLQRFGLAGQQLLIDHGIDAILASQNADGGFGDAAQTGYAALALMASGDCSSTDTLRGRAISAAIDHMMSRKMTHGAVLAALVEDWTLSFDQLAEYDRIEYVSSILRLVAAMGEDEASREGLAIAARAGIPMPSRDLGILAADPFTLLGVPATRLSATAVLARGQKQSKPDNVMRDWLRSLFERAKAAIEAGRPAPLAVLALQAPYRL